MLCGLDYERCLLTSFCHFKHVDSSSPEYFFEFVIGEDVSTICWVLAVILCECTPRVFL